MYLKCIATNGPTMPVTSSKLYTGPIAFPLCALSQVIRPLAMNSPA